jgi:hypothetical protein
MIVRGLGDFFHSMSFLSLLRCLLLLTRLLELPRRLINEPGAFSISRTLHDETLHSHAVPTGYGQPPKVLPFIRQHTSYKRAAAQRSCSVVFMGDSEYSD